MRGVAPAFVCSVGNRVVAMAVSLLGSRCSFICAFMFCLPSGYACALAAAVATLLMTAGQPQELQRTLPGARRISFADESGVIGVGALPVGQSPVWCV